MANKPNKPKSGRKSKYDTEVLPRLDDIAEMLKLGATDKEIAENLKISPQTFCEYKSRYPEFNEFIKENRKCVIFQLKTALFKRATGFKETENTVFIDSEGNETTTIKEKYYPPDAASALILLKHWDKDKDGKPKWFNDPASVELRKQEIKLKEKQVELNQW